MLKPDGNWRLEKRRTIQKFHPAGWAGSLRGRLARRMTSLLTVAVGTLAASPVWAQGCALCYNTASAAGSRGIAALRHGILILMIPPVIIFGVVCFFTLRGRNRFNDAWEDGHYGS
ncbi:MAG TPA: hypothetical protein VFD30_17255 [Terriglobia bacterium]|jgi:hypothetical protein|nr:hypothetical protein [Terriglobia bacterium]